MAAHDPRNHTKRHETQAFFRRFRVTSWIVLCIFQKMGTLVETDPPARADIGSKPARLSANIQEELNFSLDICI